MAKLVALQGQGAGKEYLLHDSTVLGRAFDTTIRIDDLTVSRHHARITRTATGFLLEDLGSGNGTFLNDRRVEAPFLLRHGDLIRISRNLFRFVETAEAREEQVGSTTTVAVVEDEESPQAAILGTLDVKQTLSGLSLPAAADLAALQQAHERLRTVVSISNAVQVQFDLDRLLEEIMNSVFRVFPQADRGFIMLRDEESGELTPRISRVRGKAVAEDIVVSRHIIAEVANKRQAVLTADAMGDQRFSQAMSVVNLRLRSMMCVPLIANDDLLGLIQVDTHRPNARFVTEDLELLTGIANQTAFAIANAKLHERLLKRERMERDLELARQVQHSFLPAGVPEVEGMEFCASYRAAQEVGGDFYDFIVSQDKIGIVVGDVSGKGIPAALLMARMSADVRFLSLSEKEPARVLAQINQRMTSGRQEDVFVTLVYIMLDLATHKMVIGNAAHCPPVLRRAPEGEVMQLEDGIGFPLGVLPEAEYEQVEFQLEPGDTIFLFTDGVTEAMNTKREQYGTDRVIHAVSHGPSSPKQLMNRLLEDIRAHVGDTPQSDDLTLLSFGLLSAPPAAK